MFPVRLVHFKWHQCSINITVNRVENNNTVFNIGLNRAVYGVK